MSRRIPLTLLAFLLASALLFVPKPAPAQAAAGHLPAMLLTLDGIKGSYSGGPFKDAIQVSSYAFDAANDSQPGSGSGSGGGKPVFGAITLAKPTDAASAPLLDALAKGKHIKDGYLYFQTTAGADSRTYMIIHFTDALVAGYQLAHGADASPTETIELRVASMLFKYVTTKPDGSPGTVIAVPIGKAPVGASAVTTQYHFEPIYAKTAKGDAYIEGFTVSLKAAAANSLVDRTTYRINGGAWTDYTAPFKIYADDTHTLEYYSTNVDGDVEKANVMDFDAGTFAGNGSF
ncbi:Type VI protein secretion system component Hcp (secreted cytotoxin) [Paenibacillus sp. UNC496MF]|uniref:type VI secretion system tube protein Hcp n=1 Tax=Paenibacillus sp. UNC496MF TaxID=1502753 RepID=UPI0008E268E8|nr:type VI secretion system tube protein Hcp [Paenibacillus sp. UNC496MF]SFJ21954.1 Type VI protein secretion system component Hcp (secreted cytotoxin) [Paenibacillus sp. UNC496MF]